MPMTNAECRALTEAQETGYNSYDEDYYSLIDTIEVMVDDKYLEYKVAMWNKKRKELMQA